MNYLRKTVALCALTLFAVGISNAQFGMRQPQMPRGLFNPVVGSGAVYEMQLANGNKTTMEIDVVGKDTVDGKDGYWFETAMSGATAGPPGGMVVKMLMVLDGANSYASKMVMQMGDRPPMEMAIPPNQGAAQKQPADIKSLAEDVGNESITTPAGTFSCEHYRMKDGSGDTWVSLKVSPYGVIKHQGKDTTMILTKVVTDAKDKITGTPQPFNPAAFGRPPQ
jgi:hypothetical protein